ncbi:MAG TPA: hypothetical protein VK167_11105 [Flavipsychrobacter sp.]|jgi:hypothetical protein|nr:hypothetical protein [Chitinophagales bacterium]HLO71411.1 hypothetical protein [Flavipsychrobacter sp.]
MKFRTGTLLALAILVTLGLSSCTREYICQCTITYSGQAGLPDTAVQEYAISNTKKKAKAKCEENSATFDRDGIKAVETCELY